jgi:hypothetical protein
LYEREADGEDDAAESRIDKGTGLSYVESAATASVPLGGFRAGPTVQSGDHPPASGGWRPARRAPADATVLGGGQIGYR